MISSRHTSRHRNQRCLELKLNNAAIDDKGFKINGCVTRRPSVSNETGMDGCATETPSRCAREEAAARLHARAQFMLDEMGLLTTRVDTLASGG